MNLEAGKARTGSLVRTQSEGSARGPFGSPSSSQFSSVLAGRHALASASGAITATDSIRSDQRLAPGARSFADVSLFGAAISSGLKAAIRPAETETSRPSHEAQSLDHKLDRSALAIAPQIRLFDSAQTGAGDFEARVASAGPVESFAAAGTFSTHLLGFGLSPTVIAEGVGLTTSYSVSPRVVRLDESQRGCRAGFSPFQESAASANGPVSLLLTEAAGKTDVVLRVSRLAPDGSNELGRRVREELAKANLRMTGLTINGRSQKGVRKQ